MTARLAPALLWGAATLMVAAAVHLVSILILPGIAPENAFSRLVRIAPPNVVTALPKPGARQETFPLQDPALVSSVCRYDLAKGALRVRADIGEAAFLAVSFHTPRGAAFYALTNRSASQGRIELLLLTPDQLDRREAADGEDTPVPEVRVTSPGSEGFVQFDVLARVGGVVAARQAAASARCMVEPVP